MGLAQGEDELFDLCLSPQSNQTFFGPTAYSYNFDEDLDGTYPSVYSSQLSIDSANSLTRFDVLQGIDLMSHSLNRATSNSIPSYPLTIDDSIARDVRHNTLGMSQSSSHATKYLKHRSIALRQEIRKTGGSCSRHKLYKTACFLECPTRLKEFRDPTETDPLGRATIGGTRKSDKAELRVDNNCGNVRYRLVDSELPGTAFHSDCIHNHSPYDNGIHCNDQNCLNLLPPSQPRMASDIVSSDIMQCAIANGPPFERKSELLVDANQSIPHPSHLFTKNWNNQTLSYMEIEKDDCHTCSPIIMSPRKSSKPKAFPCTFCDAQFTRKGYWKRHETENHEPQRRWQCPACSATFYGEAAFVRHHEHNHSCKNCVHANKAKMELPRKAAWGCGFCGGTLTSWTDRLDHVATHFASGSTKEEWDSSKVILGLLKQDWIMTAWENLIVLKHGNDCENWPDFKWVSTSDRCLELLQDLQHGSCDSANVRSLVQIAYRLGLRETSNHEDFSDLSSTASLSSIKTDMPIDEGKPSSLSCSEAAISAHLMTASKREDTPSENESSEDEYSSESESEDENDDYSDVLKTQIRADSDDIVGPVMSIVGREIVESVLDSTHFLSAPSPAVRSHAGSDGATSFQTSSSINGSGNGGQEGRGHKRGLAQEDTSGRGQDEGWNEGGPNKRRNIAKPSESKQVNTLRFACPFYKRDPEKYKHWKHCPGPGWDTVHRVKAHIYSKHARPTQCPRCWETFSDRSMYNAHLAAEERCTSQVEKVADGFSESQGKTLRSKKGLPISEYDKWMHVYSILFPQDNSNDLPSPYYVIATDHEASKVDSPDSGHLMCFEEYQRRALPRIAKQYVEAKLLEESATLKEKLQSSLLQAMPLCMEQLLQEFEQSRKSVPASPARVQAESPSLSKNTTPILGSSRSGITTEKLALFYAPPPPVGNPQNFSDVLPHPQGNPDSGYGSTTSSSLPKLTLGLSSNAHSPVEDHGAQCQSSLPASTLISNSMQMSPFRTDSGGSHNPHKKTTPDQSLDIELKQGFTRDLAQDQLSFNDAEVATSFTEEFEKYFQENGGDQQSFEFQQFIDDFTESQVQ